MSCSSSSDNGTQKSNSRNIVAVRNNNNKHSDIGIYVYRDDMYDNF